MLNATFFNQGNKFRFTDSWCSGEKTEMIFYDICHKNLFSVTSVDLNEEVKSITKTVQHKKLFRTITEEVVEEIKEYFIQMDYFLHTYDKKVSTIKIFVAPTELDVAKEVVAYIKGLIKEKWRIDKEERREKDKKLQSITEAERERLKSCKYDMVVIDFETTGIKSPMESEKYDEVLSVSIIDQDGTILLNSLCKPQHRKTWAKAQEIHGISPAMVKNQPSFEELFPTIKEILLQSKVVLAYNIAFEVNFLWGFDLVFGKPGGTQLIREVIWGPDPMLMYCAYKGNERWQKLSSVSKHFKYQYNAHDSLEDVQATLYCYKKMIEYVNTHKDKEYIIKYGYLYDNGRKGEWLDLNTYEIVGEVKERWCK